MEKEIEPFPCTVFGNGRITIPKTYRELYGIGAGTKLKIFIEKVGE